MWDFCEETTPKARKEYDCEAADHWCNAGLAECDIDDQDWQIIQKAKSENYKIKSGDRYVNVSGKWEGEFDVFRARIDMNDICHKYGLYQE